MARIVTYEARRGFALEAFNGRSPIRGRDGLPIIVDNGGGASMAACKAALAAQVLASAGIAI